MNIDKLTIEEAKEKLEEYKNGYLELSKLFNAESEKKESKIKDSLLGKKVIIRTYSAGVHFGELVEKEGEEVILRNSRRLYYWVTANNGISLSEVANAGVANNSKICSPVDILWLKAIEIIPCTDKAIKSLEEINEYRA